MGVTIHLQGTLRDDAALDDLIAIVKESARKHDWVTYDVDEPDSDCFRVFDGEVVEYKGPLKGIAIVAHEDSEPVRFEFDPDGYLQTFVKTQFAPVNVHIRIVELLRAVEPCFQSLTVEDEGAYWEKEDRAELERRRGDISTALENMINDPNELRRILEAAESEDPPDDPPFDDR
jgi:hypothetical protein